MVWAQNRGRRAGRSRQSSILQNPATGGLSRSSFRSVGIPLFAESWKTGDSVYAEFQRAKQQAGPRERLLQKPVSHRFRTHKGRRGRKFSKVPSLQERLTPRFSRSGPARLETPGKTGGKLGWDYLSLPESVSSTESHFCAVH